MQRIVLTSTALVNTPGILAWAMSGYRFKKDRPKLRQVFLAYEHPALTEAVVGDLLSGTLPHKIEGENVVIELPD